MAALSQPIPAMTEMTEAEYLVFERGSELRHEYFAGAIFAMTGASWNHNVICVNISTSLNVQIADRDCTVTAGDLRLKVVATRSYRYPDVMVICDDPQFIDERVDTISNPTVVIEVVSPSTALVDRYEKLDEYLRLDSLQEYVIGSQHEAKIERYLRQIDPGDDWLYTQVIGLQSSINLPSISCKLLLSDIYKKVTLGNRDDKRAQ